MVKLTKEAFARAQKFIQSQGRPLEGGLFELEFGVGAVDEVLTQLAAFQNPDGGFGNALEPDLRTPTSSALCTEIGLRILAELDTPADHPVVISAVEYLLQTFDPETQVWRVIPADANDYPHAPWWHDEDGSLARTFDDYLVIPRAGILAYLHHYAELVPKDWLAEVTAATLADIRTMPADRFAGGGDALIYARRLAESPGLSEDQMWLISRVRELADTIVTRDPKQWMGYCAPPLKIAPTPASITAAMLRDCLPSHLDYLIEMQAPEGYWDVIWAWSEYPEDWAVAKREWRGVLTLETLIALKTFGRIEF